MQKIFFALTGAALLVAPLAVEAHERQTFEINGINYQFVVGSVGEPVYVDDKSGVEVRIERLSILPGHEEHHHGVGPGAVEGAEQTLKVELISGNQRKTLDLSPAYGEVGLYRAPFFPTATDSISYRFFGTLEEIPIDVTFTCSPEGHQMESVTDSTRVEITPGVVRVSKTGKFGCPRDTAEMGFPYDTSANTELQKRSAESRMIDFGVGALAVAALAVAVIRRRS